MRLDPPSVIIYGDKSHRTSTRFEPLAVVFNYQTRRLRLAEGNEHLQEFFLAHALFELLEGLSIISRPHHPQVVFGESPYVGS